MVYILVSRYTSVISFWMKLKMVTKRWVLEQTLSLFMEITVPPIGILDNMWEFKKVDRGQ